MGNTSDSGDIEMGADSKKDEELTLSDTSDQSAEDPLTTLVEVAPGTAVVFGEVPEGLDLIDFGLLPSSDRAQLSTVLGSLANVGTVGGNVAEAVSSAQGLYRVNEATMALLKSGGQLAAKDGAKLGAIFKNGELVAQARFIPASMSAATIAASIGPAVAMIALQMQLGEISGLVRTNIALTGQVLQEIRNERWSKLEGMSDAVDQAFREARELGTITESVWEPVRSYESEINANFNLYVKNVTGHIKALKGKQGHDRREFLQNNAEAIFFDTQALLKSLNAKAQYQALRAAIVRVRSFDAENEAQLFESITREMPIEIQRCLKDVDYLTEALVRELRIIFELPGGATMPLSKKRRDKKAAKITCKQLLQAIEPLANTIHPVAKAPDVPTLVCAPEELDLAPYMNVLRWFLADDEQILAIAFPYAGKVSDSAGAIANIQARRIDATWETLTPSKIGDIVAAVISSTFVAVTSRRIVTAEPKALLRRGEIGETYPLEQVKFIRPRDANASTMRPAVHISTEQSDIDWLFPAAADVEEIDALTDLIDGSVNVRNNTQAAIEESAKD
ncbi:MAG: hypothetical protein ABF545_02315 [Bifidobacterium psychraerophilum]|uniref:hypothetical protein n=1 Tax=Bifidobacterium psychraerophilum TaxID=218140 RepID=UPI0039EBDB79